MGDKKPADRKNLLKTDKRTLVQNQMKFLRMLRNDRNAKIVVQSFSYICF
jgi:hypothetical protein